jgi:RecG-like helicase
MANRIACPVERARHRRDAPRSPPGDRASAEIHLVVGTQALIQQHVKFKALALCVIDEQHRFGVVQRGTLAAKGSNPDVLVMTATPIPRTLALTECGDMEVSVIRGCRPAVSRSRRWSRPIRGATRSTR